MSKGARLPVVTLLLIAANLAAAFLMVLNPELVFDHGFRADHPRARDAITALFLHANTVHLLGNMVFLAAVGAAVELSTGSFRFASVYLLSGIFGVLAHYLIVRRFAEPPPLVGASGAIAGCAAYYSVRYTAMRVPLAPNVAVPVAAVTAMWLVLQVVGAFVRLGDATGSGASFWAHMGGFGAGVLLSFIYRAPDLKQVELGHEVLERMNDRGPAALEHAAREHLRLHPNDPKALRQLAQALETQHEPEEEARVLLRLLEVLPETEQPEALQRLCELGQAPELPALRRTLLAERLKATCPELARKLLQSVVDGPEGDPQRPEAMLALAGLDREAEPERAAALLEELRRLYPLHPAVELARRRGWVG